MDLHTWAYGEGMPFIEEHVPVKNQRPESLISTADAAARIGVAEITMRLWRWQDNPHQPPYVRIGARGVRYSVAVLDSWMANRTHKPGTKTAGKNRSPSRPRGRPGPR
jgi:hypothetical protein